MITSTLHVLHASSHAICRLSRVRHTQPRSRHSTSTIAISAFMAVCEAPLLIILLHIALVDDITTTETGEDSYQEVKDAGMYRCDQTDEWLKLKTKN